jgi:hypothetical protein
MIMSLQPALSPAPASVAKSSRSSFPASSTFWWLGGCARDVMRGRRSEWEGLRKRSMRGWRAREACERSVQERGARKDSLQSAWGRGVAARQRGRVAQLQLAHQRLLMVAMGLCARHDEGWGW